MNVSLSDIIYNMWFGRFFTIFD